MNVEGIIENMIKYKPEIARVISDPTMRSLLEKEINETYQKYSRVRKFADVIDGADKQTAIAKTAMQLFGPAGKALSILVDLPELIAKGAYAVYYSLKTGDTGALPGWAFYEGMSSILPFGQILDMRDNYRKRVIERLDKLIAQKTVDNFFAKYYKRKAPLESTVAESYQEGQKKGVVEKVKDAVYKKKPEPEYQPA